jgi:hypothetical protein
MEPQRGQDVASDFVAPYNQSHIFLGEELRLSVMIAVDNSCCNGFLSQRVAYTVELLCQRELLPFEVLVHMSIYMYVLEGAIEKRLGRLEAAAYVCAFGAGPYAMGEMIAQGHICYCSRALQTIPQPWSALPLPVPEGAGRRALTVLLYMSLPSWIIPRRCRSSGILFWYKNNPPYPTQIICLFPVI